MNNVDEVCISYGGGGVQEEFGSPTLMRAKECTTYTNRQEETMSSLVKNPYDLNNFQLEAVKRKAEISSKYMGSGSAADQPGHFAGLSSSKTTKGISINSLLNMNNNNINNFPNLSSNESIFDKNKSSSKIIVSPQTPNNPNRNGQSLFSMDKRGENLKNTKPNMRSILERNLIVKSREPNNLVDLPSAYMEHEDLSKN